jgi:hypothetical protein
VNQFRRIKLLLEQRFLREAFPKLNAATNSNALAGPIPLIAQAR